MNYKKIFEDDANWGNAPQTNTSEDYLLRTEDLSRDTVWESQIGSIWKESGVVEANAGSTPVVCKVAKGYAHWFSGGEYTIPFPGTLGVIHAQKGSGSVFGFIPQQDAKTFYSLTHMPTPWGPSKEDLSYGKYTGGAPEDAILGDQGYLTVDGIGYGVLSGGPAWMGAAPMAKIAFYDQESTTVLCTKDFIHHTYMGTSKERYNTEKDISSKHVQLGDYNEYLGEEGDFRTTHVKDALHSNEKQTGEFYRKSKKEVLLSVGEVPTIVRTLPNYDPEKDKKDNVGLPPETPFKWASGNGKISQEKIYVETSTEDKYYKPFEITPPKNKAAASVHIRDDGTICIMSKQGSTIEIGEDIIITPRRDLKIVSGRDTEILSGNDTLCVSKEKTMIRSTDSAVDLLAKTDTNIYAGKSAHIESNDNNIVGTTKVSGKDIHIRGIDKVAIQAQTYSSTGNKKIEEYTSVTSKVSKTYVEGDSYNLKITGDFLQNTGRLYWSGTAFKFLASSTGLINAVSPVQINHMHSQQRDIFTIVRCGKGCRVSSITTPPISGGNIKVLTSKDAPQTVQGARGVTLSDYSTSKEFYKAPWQQTSNNTTWHGIEQSVKGISVYPQGVLKDYKNSKFVESPLTNFPIKGV